MVSREPRSGWAALAALAAADFVVVLDGLIVSVALPAIRRDLGFSDAGLQWVVNAYLLAFGGLLLLGGRIADIVGRRRTLIAGLGVFAAGALVAGMAPAAPVMVAGRALQGLGAAAAVPAALALLMATFEDERERTRALGVWSAVSSAAVPAGAVLGGFLTAWVGWRWVLLVNVPAALVPALGALWALDESRDRATPRRLEAPAAGAVCAGLTLLLLAVVQSESGGPASWTVLAPAASGVAMLVLFDAFERRSEAPLVPRDVLATPGAAASNLAAGALPVGLGAVLFLGTLYMQRVLGFTPWDTGVAYLVMSLPIVVGGPVGAWLVARLGARAVAAGGLLLQAGALGYLARAPVGANFVVDVLPALVVVGLAAPVAYVPVVTTAVVGAGQRSGVASGMLNTAQQLGNAAALAVCATVAAAQTSDALASGIPQRAALTTGYRTGFLIAALVLVVAAVPASRLRSGADSGAEPVTP